MTPVPELKSIDFPVNGVSGPRRRLKFLSKIRKHGRKYFFELFFDLLGGGVDWTPLDHRLDFGLSDLGVVLKKFNSLALKISMRSC
ncbi:hypothetical protein CEXT_646701 [Caerostris extrusa]|uniref:Uncharacterized protein n=1 Tax=Caerostris extrusa TaxID=172846 RepID=A0AAV4QWB3_CAEEX|nr:hypothetical protein CEXT_646701 [Caerostris extrusa]